jgi:xylulokinase
MQGDHLFLGIDSGTQGTKAVVFSPGQGKIIAEASAAHHIIENNAGRREQDPKWWIDACTKVLHEVLSGKGVVRERIRAIGVSGQQHGFVPLDDRGDAIRPAKLWCDTETAPQCDEITEKAGGREKVIELIGNSVAAGFTASKILWMKQHEPRNYDRLETILLPHDYINYWLTGEKKSEFGDASGTAYFDVRTRSWSTAILEAIDDSGKLARCLPELISSDTPVGTIRSAIAERFRFPPDVLVSSGGGDNMMAAIGTGNVSSGIITMSLGTSGTIYAFTDHPVVDPNGELAAFCSSSGGWLPLVCTMNVTVATELTRAALGLNLKDLNEKASSAPTGSEGIILLPYFNGERTPPLPNARASFLGLTSTNYTPENLCRASMEGATLGLRYGLEVLMAQGIEPTEIRLVGGGARSRLWRQMVADIFDRPVICPEFDEAGAMGAALQAMWCYLREKEGGASLKELTDDFVSLNEDSRALPETSNVIQYANIYQRYTQLKEKLWDSTEN